MPEVLPQMSARVEQIKIKPSLGDQIAEIVREMLSEQGRAAVAEKVNPDASFERDLGLGSLDLVELVVRCESRLEIAIPDEVAEQADTPAGWARAIQQGSEVAAKSAYRFLTQAAASATNIPIAPPGARTILDAVRYHAESAPDRIRLHLLAGSTGIGRTAGQLLDGASLVARGLSAQGIHPQDRVAIVAGGALDFFECFLGAQMAGAVPIAINDPGHPRHFRLEVSELADLLRATETSALVCPAPNWALSRVLRAMVPNLAAYPTSALRADGARNWAELPGPRAGAPAFLQVTNNRHAVPVAQDALLAGLRAFGDSLDLRGGDAVAGCTALTGLWGLRMWLFSLFYGLPFTYIQPSEFAEHPERWLWAIHNSKSTIAVAPNSVFETCARRLPLWACEGLDLRAWRCAVNAGELVRPDGVQGFAKRFAQFSLAPNAMRTAYATSESGVLTVSSAVKPIAADAQGFLSLGPPLPGMDLRAVEGQVEYRHHDERAWSATGDLGYLRDGELTVTGRAAEGVKVDGTALNPHAVEAAVATVTGILPDGAAAFSNASAPLMVAAESIAANSLEAPRVIQQIRHAAASVGATPDRIALVPPGSLPRTVDGAIRRSASASLAQRDSLGAVDRALWLDHLPSFTSMAVRSGLGKVERRYRVWQAGSTVGRTAITSARARLALHQMGRQAVIEGELVSNTLVVVHRSGPLDALAFAAFARVPLRFAGDAVLAGTPPWLHACLRPLIAATPEQMRQAVEQGVLVLFPDNDLGEPAYRSRFRLPAFQSATTVVPAVVVANHKTITIRLDRPMRASDPVATREMVRAALSRMRGVGA